MSNRIFYAAGYTDVISAHRHWSRHENEPNEFAIGYSNQFFDFCRDIGAEAYVVTFREERQIIHDGLFTIENRPKPTFGAAGFSYHFKQIFYGLSLLATAVRFRANVVFLHSGSTHFFAMSLFRLAGMRVVPILHNTLWPRGFPPVRFRYRVLTRLNSLFFRWAATATIAVSPECSRQVDQITRGQHKKIYEIRAQYYFEDFKDVPSPPSFDRGPFRILFVGRIAGFKGEFDILQMARKIEDLFPGRVRWNICGVGPSFEELQLLHREMGLESIVLLHGWKSAAEQLRLYGLCNAAIVPTRSTFAEGMAVTAIESILAGRPVITNQVVPALEVLRPACVEARTDDIDSYVESILKLIDDPNLYQTLCKACPDLSGQFYDRGNGFTAILKQVIRQ